MPLQDFDEIQRVLRKLSRKQLLIVQRMTQDCITRAEEMEKERTALIEQAKREKLHRQQTIGLNPGEASMTLRKFFEETYEKHHPGHHPDEDAWDDDRY